MAHLLNVAKTKKLRRIFVVLPFTNIIDQSVDIYRNLVSTGESPEKAVAAHHHKAEFEDISSRVFSFLWNAPITVTTAVQFLKLWRAIIPLLYGNFINSRVLRYLLMRLMLLCLLLFGRRRGNGFGNSLTTGGVILSLHPALLTGFGNWKNFQIHHYRIFPNLLMTL